MEKCLIVAVADNWGIGIKNQLPWHIAEDLKYFKA
jgi:dihydrofolate reductase